MNMVEKLLHEKEKILQKKKAAQSMCNIPMAEQYRITLEAIERQIIEALKKE